MAANGLGIILFRYADGLLEKGYSRNTIHLYTQALEHFGFWRAKHHPHSQSVPASEVAEFLNSHLSRCDCPPPAATHFQTCQSALNRFGFLRYLEEERGNCVRTRNLRLAALRSFFRYAGACEGPEVIAQTQRIMAIPLKRFARPLLDFLSQSEMQAILQAMDNSWSGRRDHLLFLFLYNTGARVCEALSVRVQDVQRDDYRYGQRTPANALHGVYSLTHCEPGSITLKTKPGTD
jgi:site-specific recombinase XerD